MLPWGSARYCCVAPGARSTAPLSSLVAAKGNVYASDQLVTPVRRSARKAAADSRPPSAMLQEAGYAYAPNHALRSESATGQDDQSDHLHMHLSFQDAVDPDIHSPGIWAQVAGPVSFQVSVVDMPACF